jgi:inorganic pyrophosphatase
MNYWHDIPIGKNVPEEFNCIIEIPKGSYNKYEIDKETGMIALDRANYSYAPYPFDYGFVPQTLWDDGDPIDVLVLSHEPFVPGCLVDARPIGTLAMNDSGEDDVKLLAVPADDPRFNGISDISHLEPHSLEEIQHFFRVYKDLQKKKVEVGEWEGPAKAIEQIKKSLETYKNTSFSQ